MAMVRSVNKVFITGRLGSIYERKPLPDNRPGPLNISIATTSIFTGGKQRTDWHKITLWGATADFVEKYVAVGALVHVEGALRTVQKTNPDGSTSAYVNVEGHQLTLLVNSPRDAKPHEDGEGDPAGDDTEPPDDRPKNQPDEDDDVPF